VSCWAKKRSIQPTEWLTKGERVLWIRVLLKTFTKRRGRFVKNPDSHKRDNWFCVWTATLLVLALQMGQSIGRCSPTVPATTDYSTGCRMRAGGCPCLRNSCHCHR
jgi:hypothetical protein